LEVEVLAQLTGFFFRGHLRDECVCTVAYGFIAERSAVVAETRRYAR